MSEPTFFYDFSSPYAYLSAHRVDDVMPVRVHWQPIAFGAVIRQIGKVPWSMQPGREAQQRECEQRAADLGLPLVWPAGWPEESYSILVLRAALVAADHGKLKEFSLAAFRHGLGEGGDLRGLDGVLACAREAGLDGELVTTGVQEPEIKQRLRDVTEDAIARGVTGIPTVSIGDTLFWGDDRLLDAAAAL